MDFEHANAARMYDYFRHQIRLVDITIWPHRSTDDPIGIYAAVARLV